MRLIDADELERTIELRAHNYGITVANKCNFKEFVRIAPSVDAAPIVHAHWIERCEKTWCSACATSNKSYKPPYCPHCGARMDERKDGEYNA